MGNGFRRGTQKRNQTFPWILTDHSQSSIFFDGPVNDWIAVDLFINGVQVFIQSEKLNDERLFNSLIEEEFPVLPD
jgi:gamma-glutamylcysteine synthetase